MEEDRNIEAIINGELRLPDVIIQRIQSFLKTKEAAQTTFLSRSWYRAWLTRPNLHLDERYFHSYSFDDDKFSEFANKTVKRYEESNLKIESFSLRMMESVRYDDSDLATELILKALKLGASRLSLKIQDCDFVLPHEVFGSESLVQLFVKGFVVDLGRDHIVRCSRLESLSLRRVRIDSGIISNIISACPLIKNLSLAEICKSKRRHCRINLPKLHNLTCLALSIAECDTLFFDDLSSKFPSLKDLTMNNCSVDKEEIQISSHSLERLNFTYNRFRVKFDVPNIHKFTCEGSFIPSLSFKSTSTEWESHVSITDDCCPSTSWFSELKVFLTELGRSKIYLYLNFPLVKNFDYEAGDIQCLLRREVENLTVDMEYLPSLTCYALYDGLFRLCRPKFITQIWNPDSFRHPRNDFLCKRLIQGLNEKCSFPSQFMYGLHDLEEVNAEIFERNVAEWQSLPLKSLLEASKHAGDEQKVRFQLIWRS